MCSSTTVLSVYERRSPRVYGSGMRKVLRRGWARLFRRARNGELGSTTCWDCRSTPTPRWMRTSLAKVGPLSLRLSSRGTPGTPPNAAASTTSIGALTSEF